MFYFHICIVILALLACYKLGDWKNWQKYYSTILYFMMGDFIYLVLFRKTMLWTYNTNILNHTLINILILFTVYPSTILIFIPYCPNGAVRRAVYIFSWTALFAFIEFISYTLGCFNYHNGWNLGWSIIFCIIMFPLQHLHFCKPLRAWCLTIIELVIFMIIFKVDVINLL